MTVPRYTRRKTLLAGCSLLGASGCLSFTPGQSKTPGSEGFNIGTVPEDAGSLLLVQPDNLQSRSPEAVLGRILLQTATLDELPQSLRALVSGKDASTGVTASKLVMFGSINNSGSTAIVWTTASERKFLELVGITPEAAFQTELGKDRSAYTKDDISVVGLRENVFAVGTTSLVQALVGVWDNDGEPVTEPVVTPFERTAREKPVRFATTTKNASSILAAQKRDEYQDLVNVSISGNSEKQNALLEVSFGVESMSAAKTVAQAFTRHLGIEEDDRVVEPALPRGIRSDLTVKRVGTVVTIEYEDKRDTVSKYTPDVLSTIENVILNSSTKV